jgi:glycerol kinase
VLVPAFNGLFAPYWRTDARGVLVGLSGSITRAHVARATLEAVAHQSRELLDAMDAEAGAGGGKKRGGGAAAARELKVDGGMTQNGLLMQFQADVTGRRVVRPVVSETTALGAAYAAGLAVGVWKSQAELSAQWARGAQWDPTAPAEAVARSVRDWERAVARAVNWAIPEDVVDPAMEIGRAHV